MSFPMHLLPNYHELSTANKDKTLDIYLNLRYWALFWCMKFSSRSLTTAKWSPEGQTWGRYHWPHGRCQSPVSPTDPPQVGRHSREQDFIKKTILLFIGIKIVSIKSPGLAEQAHQREGVERKAQNCTEQYRQQSKRDYRYCCKYFSARLSTQ